MTRGHIHVKHAPHGRRDSSCPNGLYSSPKFEASVDSLQPLAVSWDPSCIPDDKPDLDLWLYVSGAENPRVHLWKGLSSKQGSLDIDIEPRWWNNTSPQRLQLILTPANVGPALSPFQGGPSFLATYSQPSSGAPPSADLSAAPGPLITWVNANQNKGMTPGKKAAAAIIPLLFVALCIGVFIKIKRTRGQKKREAFKQDVDRRMSTISTDWRSISAAGATAAIRNSIAVGNRNSAFSFGAIRPQSTYHGDDLNEKGDSTDETGKSAVSQARKSPGVGLRNPAGMASTDRVSRVSFAPDTRVSRVSFAESTRPSVDRRTKLNSTYVPPVPALPEGVDQAHHGADNESNSSEAGDGTFSPRQKEGALTLTPEDIRARIASKKSHNNTPSVPSAPAPGIEDVLPALSMMRSGNGQDDYLFSRSPVSVPAPTHAKLQSSGSPPPQSPTQLSSPVMSSLPMQAMPANVMSPDEMLRAYAERKKQQQLQQGKIAYPANAATSTGLTHSSSGSGSMRALYDAATGTVVSPTNTGNALHQQQQEEEDLGNAYDYNSTYPASSVYTHSSSAQNHNGHSIVPDMPPTTTSTVYGQHTQSMATSEYSDYSAGGVYTANAAYAFGYHHPNATIGGDGVKEAVEGGGRYTIGDDDDEDVQGPYGTGKPSATR